MAQVFSADCVMSTTATNIPTTSETPLVTGNFISPPFQNGKVMVQGMMSFTVGAGTTGVVVIVRRNPNSENSQVVNQGFFNVIAGNKVLLNVLAADLIPDGRPVQYQLTVTQNAATGNGTASLASIAATMLSG